MLLDLISPRNFVPRHKLRTSWLCEPLPSSCYFPVIVLKHPNMFSSPTVNNAVSQWHKIMYYCTRCTWYGAWKHGVDFHRILGRYLTSRPEPTKISNNKKSVRLACTIVATISPKLKAIWVTLEESPKAVTLLQPTKTRKNVPKNSADSMRHMLRLSVMSWNPITAFAPAYQHTHFN